jgi:hypothetical protein
MTMDYSNPGGVAKGFSRQVSEKIKGFFKDTERLKSYGAALGILTVGGIVYGVSKKLKKKKLLPPIRGIRRELSVYIQVDPAWYEPCYGMSRFHHVAPASFEVLCSSVANLLHLLYKIGSGETRLTASTLSHLSDHMSPIVECIRIIRAHVVSKYGYRLEVMDEFDALASSMQSLCDNIQYNFMQEVQHRQVR